MHDSCQAFQPVLCTWRAVHLICTHDGPQVDVFDDKGDQLTQLSHELMTAIPPRVTVHPSLPVLAAGTGSGRMHVYRHPA